MRGGTIPKPTLSEEEEEEPRAGDEEEVGGIVVFVVVEEDVGVVEPAVEMALEAPETVEHTRQLLVACQDHNGSVLSGSLRIHMRLRASADEDLVVLLVDFADDRRCPG